VDALVLVLNGLHQHEKSEVRCLRRAVSVSAVRYVVSMFWSTCSVSEVRGELVELEVEVSHVRCRQHVLVNELDMVNAAAGDGYRSRCRLALGAARC